MQRIRFVRPLAVLMGCLGIVLSAAHAAPRTSVDLSSGWQFRQRMPATATPAEWRPATVPGDVHLDLLANKLIPDPFYRDNEAKLQWIQDADWEYRTTITATPAMLSHEHVIWSSTAWILCGGLAQRAPHPDRGQHVPRVARRCEAVAEGRRERTDASSSRRPSRCRSVSR